MTTRSMGIGIGGLLVGLVIGAVAVWLLAPAAGGVEPDIVRGQTTAVSEDGEGIGMSLEGSDETRSYTIVGAMWQNDDLPWQDSFPTCVEPGRTGQALELGVVEVVPTGTAPGETVVVWVKCL